MFISSINRLYSLFLGTHIRQNFFISSTMLWCIFQITCQSPPTILSYKIIKKYHICIFIWDFQNQELRITFIIMVLKFWYIFNFSFIQKKSRMHFLCQNVFRLSLIWKICPESSNRILSHNHKIYTSFNNYQLQKQKHDGNRGILLLTPFCLQIRNQMHIKSIEI